MCVYTPSLDMLCRPYSLGHWVCYTYALLTLSHIPSAAPLPAVIGQLLQCTPWTNSLPYQVPITAGWAAASLKVHFKGLPKPNKTLTHGQDLNPRSTGPKPRILLMSHRPPAEMKQQIFCCCKGFRFSNPKYHWNRVITR